MAYMTILKKTKSQLRLLREPTLMSKGIFAGFLFGVIGVILFGSESYLFKVIIGLCAVFLSCFMVDNYEVCDMNKETSEVRFTRMHLCQYFLGGFLAPHPYVTCKLADIRDVRVEGQQNDNAKMSYRVVLALKTGIQLGLTEVFTNYELNEYGIIIETIMSFLGFKMPVESSDSEYDCEGDGSSSEDEMDLDEEEDDDDDDFEQITKEDIEGMEEDGLKIMGRGDTADAGNRAGGALSIPVLEIIGLPKEDDKAAAN